MSEWKKVKFLDYIELNPKVLINKGEVCPFIEMANVDCNMRQPRSFEYKPFTSGVKFQTYDTVIARIEPCLQNGKGFLYSEREAGFGSTEYLIFRAKDGKTNPLFVYYLMRTHEIKTLMCNSMSGATGRQRVNNDVFSNLEILCPSVDTQKRIATILSRYDSLIENYQKQIKLLEESAQRLYKEWFIDLRFPGHENTKIVDGVHEGWEKKTLDSFCNVFTGKKNANQGVSNGKYKFFTCGDTPLLIDSYIYDGPAIIISGNGSYTGRTTFYEGKFDLYQRTYACSMKDMQDKNLIYGLFEIVKCELTNKISGGTHGAAIPYIVMSDVTKFDFIYEENIMQRFSSIMHNILSESLSLLNQIRHLTEARDRLLPKLMNGEIEV